MSNPQEQKSDANPFEGFTSGEFLDGAPVVPAKAGEDSAAGDGKGTDEGGDDGAEDSAAGDATDVVEGAGEADTDNDGDDATDGEDGEKAVAEAAKQPDKKPKKSAEERIGEVTRARREAERRADAAEARLAALERGDAKKDLTTQKEVAKDDSDRPTPDKYEYGELDGKYIADVVKYDVKQAIAAEKAEELKVRQTEAAAAKQQEHQAKAGTLLETGREKYKDFDDKVIDSPVVKEITQVFHDLIIESDVGADIAYYLASNPKEAREAFSKPPLAQAAYFGRLEARFSAPPKAEKKPDPQPVTKAPDPVKQPRGAGGKFATSPDTQDFEAFEALANR